MDIRSVRGPTQPVPAAPDQAPQPASAKPAAPAPNTQAAQPVTQTAAATAAAASAAQDPQKLKEALKSINETIQAMSPELEFTMDSDTHRTVVKLIDQSTKEVLRQMPTEEALNIAKALDKLQGLLIKQKA